MKLALGIMTLFQTLMFTISNAAHPKVERACRSRMEADFESLHLRVVVTRDIIAPTEPLAETMVGSHIEYEYWLSENRTRVDFFEQRPADPRNSSTTRFARDGNIRRLLPSLDNDPVLMESTRQGLNDKEFLGVVTTVSVDPLALGFWPAPFGSLDQFEFTDLIEMFRSNEFTEITESISANESRVIKGEIREGSPFWWTISFAPGSDVPSEIVFYGRAGTNVRETLNCDWVNVGGLPLPSLAKFTRYSAKNDILWQETWAFSDHSLNHPIPDGLLTWESLGIWNGAAVEFQNSRSSTIKQYQDGKFQEWKPTPVFNETISTSEFSSFRRLFLVLNMIAIAVLLIWFGLRRKSERES